MKCDSASCSAVRCSVLPGCSLTTVMVIVDRATTRVRYRLLLLSVAVLYFSFQLSFSFEEIKNAWILDSQCILANISTIKSLLHNSTSTMRLLVLVIMYNLPCYLLQFTFCSISQPKLWTIKLITPRLRAAECQALDWGQVAHSGMEGDSNLHFSPASWQWMIASFQSCWSWKEFLHNAMSLFSLQSRFAQRICWA